MLPIQLNGSEGSISHKNDKNESNNSPNLSSNGAIPALFNPKTSSQHGSGSIFGSSYALKIDQLSNASMSPKFDFLRRRSHSFDSQKSNERLIMHHMEDFDEKEAFDLDEIPFDEEKLRHEIQLDLMGEFEKEKQEMNDKYDTLQRKYDQLKIKYDREINPRNRSFILDSDDTSYSDLLSLDMSTSTSDDPDDEINKHLYDRRARERKRRKKEMKKEKSHCWMIFPWSCN